VNFGPLGRFGSGNLTDSGHKKIVGGAKVGTEAVGSRPFSGVVGDGAKLEFLPEQN
jgi:hypothetical protein